MIKNLPFQFKDLEIHIQKMLVQINELAAEVEALSLAIDAIELDIDDLTTKQENEKLIQCIASQRTINSGASGAIVASDGTNATAGNSTARRLNNLEMTEGASAYFDPINANFNVPIKKAGTYLIESNMTIRRAGITASSFINVDLTPSGYLRCSSNDYTITTSSGTTGNALSIPLSTKITVTSGQVPAYVGLYGYITNKTGNEAWGLFYTLSGNYTDTCSLKITLIKE